MPQNTAYFREFLDFAYLWMRDKGKDVPAAYRPTTENQDLWKHLTEVLPEELFELCPMHYLGRLIDRPPLASQFIILVDLRNRSVALDTCNCLVAYSCL